MALASAGPAGQLLLRALSHIIQAKPEELYLFFFNMILDPECGSGDQNRGFSSLIAPLVLSVRDFKIRVKGLGKLSLLSGYASALGLSQSLALNLPLALTFLWVLGRGPASKGRGHEALPKWEPRRCRGIAASV